MTLAMALDGSGFPRRSRVFAANSNTSASEPATLKDMLSGLGAAPRRDGGDGLHKNSAIRAKLRL